MSDAIAQDKTGSQIIIFLVPQRKYRDTTSKLPQATIIPPAKRPLNGVSLEWRFAHWLMLMVAHFHMLTGYEF